MLATTKPAEEGTPVSHWSLDDLATHILNDAHFRDMHRSTIQRILAEAELKPHKVRSWMHSDDPEFEKKALDICGLYLAAPALFKKGELVLSTDEKTSIQALERIAKDKPMQVGRPVKPMLAASEPTIADALARVGGNAAIEWKLDGIRIQAHVRDGEVRLFTRTLDDITPRLPEVVAELRALPVRSAVFDGELIALRADGRPLPFQDTAARAATGSERARSGGTGSGGTVPLSAFLFDVLHLDGGDLIDQPDAQRRAALAGSVPEGLIMPRLVTADPVAAAEFFADAIARGHEGVVVKALDAPYAAGRRGAAWIKVKPRHTLDLVVLAAEWGHGRRKGWLSNLHLGARDPSTGGWVMLGKTFKGLTDELLAWQTTALQELADHSDSWVVYVRPELVVEIAFDGVDRKSVV